MRNKSVSFAGAALAAALVFPLPAFAGVTIAMQRGGHPTTTLYADGDRLRVDDPGRDPALGPTEMLLDAVGKRMVIIRERDKTYTEITEADRQRLKAQMDGMRAQMEERMKNMPPEQRQKMEGMMGKLNGAAAVAAREWKFEPLGQKKSVNGFPCEMYRVMVDGKPQEEDCVSPWSAGLVKKEDFSGLQKFSEEMSRDFAGGSGAPSRGPFMSFDKAPGIPVSRVPIEADGKRGEEEQVKSVKRGPLAAALFAIPAGFTKKELPMGHGPARHAPAAH
jgi:hypothetical protein